MTGPKRLLVQRLLDSKVCTLHSRKSQLKPMVCEQPSEGVWIVPALNDSETSLGMAEAFLCPWNKFTLGTFISSTVLHTGELAVQLLSRVLLLGI